MITCTICSKPVSAENDDVVEYTDGTIAHGECHDDVVDAQAAMADFEKNGGVSLEELKAKIQP